MLQSGSLEGLLEFLECKKRHIPVCQLLNTIRHGMYIQREWSIEEQFNAIAEVSPRTKSCQTSREAKLM